MKGVTTGGAEGQGSSKPKPLNQETRMMAKANTTKRTTRAKNTPAGGGKEALPGRADEDVRLRAYEIYQMRMQAG